MVVVVVVGEGRGGIEGERTGATEGRGNREQSCMDKYILERVNLRPVSLKGVPKVGELNRRGQLRLPWPSYTVVQGPVPTFFRQSFETYPAKGNKPNQPPRTAQA